jgi:hypothetical protein
MNKWRDFLIVMRPLWIIIIFQLLIAVSLNIPPQGQDMMYIVIESINAGSLWSLLWFAIALFYLSIVSEFGIRFILNLSNITTLNLLPNRIRYRKNIQKNISKFVLFAPATFAIIGFIKTYLYKPSSNLLQSFCLVIFSILVVICVLYIIYFGALRSKLYVLKLNKHAKLLLAKLSGIFELYNFGTAAKPNLKKLAFQDYKPLLLRFFYGLVVSAILIVTFSYLPINYYAKVGGTALIVLSFACWLSIYYLIEFFDKVSPLKIGFPCKLLVVLLLVIFSYINNDHPVRLSIENSYKIAKKLSLNSYFENWVSLAEKDTSKEIAVLFIAAEGGALRTGCFTSMVLAKLKDKYDKDNEVFKNNLFCYSSVSGGTLGVNFFNSLQNAGYKENYAEATKAFYEQDFLSPTTGKLIFGEIINYFLPKNFEVFDRAVALEKSWETAWHSIPNCANYSNVLAENFDHTLNYSQPQPAIFINTTEVETGKKAVLSNIKIDDSVFKETTDLSTLINKSVNYSTAISLSARFPILSPAGMVQIDDETKLHYVDGGYYENTGTETLRDVIVSLKQHPVYGKKIKPYVLLFSFGEKDTTFQKGISFFNEIAEPALGIVNVRSGHSYRSVEELKTVVDSKNFIQIALPVNARNVPMNWVLSARALSSIEKECNTIIDKNNRLKFWFLQDFKK